MLEKGGFLPKDGSTLDVQQVFGEERFKNREPWTDPHNQPLTPSEYYNVGGKTKWYGAALLRFSPHEFDPDPEFQCPGWPIGYGELEPFYKQAEELLQINRFGHEPQLTRLIKRIIRNRSDWRAEPLPMGLDKAIQDHPNEAQHFDGFASQGGYKADAETRLLKPLFDNPLFTLLPQKEVSGLLPAWGLNRINGVRCTDGSLYHADTIVLAAGAMSSPRILDHYLQQNGTHPNPSLGRLNGTQFKMHLNSVLLGFSPFKQHDMLRKTALFLNDKFPHSSVQCLGWLDGEILSTQLPKFVPTLLSNWLGARAYGFFVTTEDGSTPDNRVVAGLGSGQLPKLDYEQARTPKSVAEHDTIIKAFKIRLLQAGLFSIAKQMGLNGTAHALGSMVTGNDTEHSVVDANGKVHGFDNLYVADGSVLPRSSRVNPALTIYAWGLRLGRHLSD